MKLDIQVAIRPKYIFWFGASTDVEI